MKFLPYGLFLLFFQCLALILNGQAQQPPVANFTPRDFGKNQPPEVYSICKDERGFIYGGSVGGLLQYDGHDWQFIKVKTGEKIDDLKYVGDQKIACGGLNYFGLVEPDETGNLKYNSLVHLLPDTLKNFEIITIQSVGKKVFFQSKFVLFVYENGKVNIVLPNVSFFRGYECEGRYFVRDRENGLFEWKKNKLELFASDTLSKNYGFFGMVSYDKANFLVATHDVGFYLMSKKSGIIKDAPSFFYEDYAPLIYDLKKLDHDLYALATINHGVIIIDKDLDLKTRISRNDGLKSSFINKIVVDNIGNVWAASSGGISFIDIHSPLHFYSEASGLPGNVEDVDYLGSYYYAATSTGFYLMPQYFSDDLKPWRKIDAVKSQVSDLDKNEKDILIASGEGIFAGTLNSYIKIKSGNYQSIKHIPGINKIIALTPDYLEIFDSKYVLESTLYFDERIQRSLSFAIDTSANGRTRVWIGLAGQGVYRLDILSTRENKLELFNDADGLMPGVVKPYNFIGKIIFLTENGFQHFISEEEVSKSLTEEEKNNPEFNRGYFDAFHIPEMDIKGNIQSMILDQGRIYLSLDGELCYFDREGKKYHKEFSALKLGRINELRVIGNQVWISAAEGVAEFFPNHFKQIDLTFDVYFRNIQDGSKTNLMNEFFVDNEKFSLTQTEVPSISYKSNTMNFVFSTDYFDNTHRIEYSYLLEGESEEWSSWSKENKLTLNNLHEGEYTLRIKARNVYGTESKEAVYKFIILPPWYRTWWAYILYVLVAVLIIYVAIRISSYQLKQSNVRLEKTVQERTLEIANKNDELQHQNDQILHQKQEITDSINYAKRIQEAILPIKSEIQKVFPNSFVLFKPKDIVSGDFYWFANQNNVSIFICADCTGHGVPGAFMSMICTDRLNHTVLEKKITSPSALLKEVNQGIKRSLKQEDESNLKTKDGMDNAVCSFNHATNELLYAGANRPLWLLRNNEITEYKPTKTAVGGFTPEDQHFDENKIQIEKGDIVYLSTDGYADQFGGPRGKKLMVKAFKEILIENSNLSFEEQHNKLDTFIEDWRLYKTESNTFIEQIDDICVIGIQF